MKKNFLLSAILMAGISFGANSQQLATFEDGGANDKVEQQCNWFDGGFYLQAPGIMANTHKTGYNTSDNAVGIVSVAPVNGGWWWGRFMGFRLKNEETITITEENRYLKMLAYKGEQANNIVFYFGEVCDGAPKIWEGKLSKTGEWVGLVIDLGAKHMGEAFSKVTICVDASWGSDASTTNFEFMLDNIELSGDPLPTGVTPVKDLSEFNLKFENSTEKWVKEYSVNNEKSTYSVVDNSHKTDVNGTDKVLEFNKSEEASWWQGMTVKFANSLEISPDYQYLHAFAYVPSSALDGRESVDVQVCATDFMANENVELIGLWDDQVDEWVDLVVPITQIAYLDEVTYRFDVRKNEADEWVNSPANTYYLDEITLNNNPEPRAATSGVAGVVAKDNIAIAGRTGEIAVAAKGAATVNVYDVKGALVAQKAISGTATIDANKGFYIVQVISAEGTKTAKVAVK